MWILCTGVMQGLECWRCSCALDPRLMLLWESGRLWGAKFCGEHAASGCRVSDSMNSGARVLGFWVQAYYESYVWSMSNKH
jgi:hypothetical protein